MSEKLPTGQRKHRTEAGSLTLSPKPFSEYQVEEFKSYVEGLYVKPPEPVRKRGPAKLTIKKGKKGGLVIHTSRKPYWAHIADIVEWAHALGMTEASLKEALLAKGFKLFADAAAGLKFQKEQRNANSSDT